MLCKCTAELSFRSSSMVSMIQRQVKYLAKGNGYIVGVINAKMFFFYHLRFYSWMKRRKKNRQLARGKGKLKFHLPGGKGTTSAKMRGCEVERGDLGTGCFKKSAGQRIKSQDLFTRGCWVKA